MKQLLIIFLLSLGCVNYHYLSSPPNYPMEKFHENEEIARYLYGYDIVAWWSSDSVMTEDEEKRKELSAEWFCIPQENYCWIAVYGKWDTVKNEYLPIFQYHVDDNANVTRINSKLDSTLVAPRARALHSSLPYIFNIMDSTRLKLNWYVHVDENKQINVWALPESVSPNGVAYYGGEFCYTYNPAGDSLLSKYENYIGYRGYKPDIKQRISLNSIENDIPTVGNIFYAILHRKNFKSIRIKNKVTASMILYNKNTNGWTWIHSVP